jgi:hypothetical protein
MKKLALLVAMLLGGLAFAKLYRSATEVQGATRSTPRVDAPVAGEYLDLSGVKKIRVSVCSCPDAACNLLPSRTFAAGEAITACTLLAWYYNPVTDMSGWMPNPDLDLTVGAVAGCRVFPDIASPSGNTGGSVFFATSGCAQSGGGTNFRVTLEGIQNE